MQQHEVMIYLNAMFLPVSLTLFTLGNTYMGFFFKHTIEDFKIRLENC